MIWLTSDLHFGHRNIVEYCNRPYRTLDGQPDWEAMNNDLVERFKSVIKPGDTVYFLGDIGMGNVHKKIEPWVKEITADTEWHWIRGNHDVRGYTEKLAPYFKSIRDYKELRHQGQLIIMSHYPMLAWNESHHGSIMLHGHNHGELRYPFDGRIMDVGVDANGLMPVSIDQVFERMLSKDVTKHHERDSLTR